MVARKITVRAPNAAPGATAAVKAMPGVPVVDLIPRMSLTTMSAGPLIVTCMDGARPSPNNKTVTVCPGLTVEPVLLADPWLVVVVPSTTAFSGGEAAGGGTTTSIPEAVAPGARTTVKG